MAEPTPQRGLQRIAGVAGGLAACSVRGYRREDLHDTFQRYLPVRATEAELAELVEPPSSQRPDQVPHAAQVPEPLFQAEPDHPPLTCTVPQVPEVPLPPDRKPAAGHAELDDRVLACLTGEPMTKWHIAKLAGFREAWHVEPSLARLVRDGQAIHHPGPPGTHDPGQWSLPVPVRDAESPDPDATTALHLLTTRLGARPVDPTCPDCDPDRRVSGSLLTGSDGLQRCRRHHFQHQNGR